MATVEIELRKYKKYKTKLVNGEKVRTELKDALMPLVLRVTAGKDVSRKNTGLYIKEAEWDSNKRRVNRRHPEWARINDALDRLVKEAEGVKADIIAEGYAVRADEVTTGVFATHNFYHLAEQRKNKFAKAGKYGSEKNYDSMMSVMRGFAPTLSLEQITPKFLEAFRDHLRDEHPVISKTGKKRIVKASEPNTVIYILSKVKAVIANCGLKVKNPFDTVVLGSYKSSQEIILSSEDIQKIRNYIPAGYWQRIAKDTFLFSFYSAGMSSKDVLQLKWDQVQDGRINFGRQKVKDSSGVQLSLPLNPVLEEIISRQDNAKETVFGLVKNFGEGRVASKEREVIQASINRALKLIALIQGSGRASPTRMPARHLHRSPIKRAAGMCTVYSRQWAIAKSVLQKYTSAVMVGPLMNCSRKFINNAPCPFLSGYCAIA